MTSEESIKRFAIEELGADLVAICHAKTIESARSSLRDFINQGYQGEMAYLEDVELRANPRKLLPDAQSIIILALNYYREKPATPVNYGRVSRYAWGRDYHKVFRGMLRKLQKHLEENFPENRHKICVDSAPLLEKAYAREAGIGFYGKNGLLINPEIGSFFLLGELVTTLRLTPDQPSPSLSKATCGTCTRCLDACPTGALRAPGQLDARRCISYLTIETKRPVPPEFEEKIGNLIMGCDICQEVCPYNKALAKKAQHKAFREDPIAGDQIPLAELLRIENDEEYLTRFAGSPLMRPKRVGLLHSALTAAGNALRENPAAYGPELVPLIEKIAASDPSQALRAQASRLLRSFRSC